MTIYKVTTEYDPKTKTLTATRGSKSVSKTPRSPIVIGRDHGLIAGDLLLSLGVKRPMTLVLHGDRTEVKPNSFKFHVEVTKP